MTFTTASGLLPAGIAVYVQREPNGIGLETPYPVGLADLTSLRDRGRSNSLLPAWENGSSGGVHPNKALADRIFDQHLPVPHIGAQHPNVFRRPKRCRQ